MSQKEAKKRINIVSLKIVREGSLLYESRKLATPADAVGLGRQFLEDADREQVIVCCLDTKNQPINVSVVSVGTINSSLVHPREVFKTAVLSNATGIILFHNHPSGDPEPSKEDINISKRISEAGTLMGIDLVDHLIIGSDGRYVSLKEEKLF